MARLWADSFANYGEGGDMLGVWDVAAIGSFTDLTTPEQRAVSMTSSAHELQRGHTAGKQFVLHIYMNARGGGGTRWNEVIQWKDSGGTVLAQLDVERASGAMRFSRGTSTVIAETGAGDVLPLQSTDPGVAALVEIKLKLADDATGELEVRLGGATVMEFEGETSANSNDSEALRLSHGTASNHDIQFTLPVLMDWSGASMNDFTGPLTPVPLELVADVTADMTPDSGTDNHDRVNEENADGDTSYVETDAVGDVDDYEAENTSFPENQPILFVRQCTIQRMSASGSTHIEHRIKPDGAGAVHSSDPHLISSESYRSAETYWDEDPEAEDAWERSRFTGGIEVGQEHSAG